MPSAPLLHGTFRTDERARAAYAEGAGIYRIVPRAVAVPADAADVARLVRWAAAERVPLVPRGAGSGMGGGNVGDGVIVDLTRLAAEPIAVCADERLAIASAGASLAELNAAAAPHGLRLPPDPSSGGWATLGGMLSTNAAGARSVRYGSIRRWALGATMITADGETVTLCRRAQAGGGPTAFPDVAAVERFTREAAPRLRTAATTIRRRFPATRKNSSGYALDAWLDSDDILDLVIGAEGTLGLVTETVWQLDAVPRYRAGLRVVLDTTATLGDVVAALLAAEPSAIELLDRTFLDLVAAELPPPLATAVAGAEAVLLVELERDDPAALQRAVMQAAAAAAEWSGGVETALTAEATERLWSLRHAASPLLAALPPERRSLQVIEDGCVPVARLGEYVRLVRRAAAARGISAVLFGHAGDGHIHVNLLPELARAGWEQEITGLLDDVTEALVQLGGTPSGEHGDGRLRAGLLARFYGAEVIALFRAVKQAFDPLGILNPGIILPADDAEGCAAAMNRLKVGADAVPLPVDIARALRAIEQTGGYRRHRLEVADET